MNSSGIPDLLAFSRLSRAVTNIKSQADTARTEAVTGRVDDITTEVKGDIGGVHLLKKAVEDAQAYQVSLSLASNRAERTQTILGRMATDSSRIATETLAQLGVGNASSLKTSAAEARASVVSIFSLLNTTEGGRALFGGDVVDQPPLVNAEALLTDVQTIITGAPDAASANVALDFYFNDPAGGFATNIYAGGAGDAPPVEISPGVRINTSVKANAQPIKDLIRGLAVTANYSEAPSGNFDERDKLAISAVELTLSAENSFSELRAAIGVVEAQIDASINRHAAEETVLTSLFNSKTLRDPFEAASQLQLLESQLEASYLLTARISRLSLANFLR